MIRINMREMQQVREFNKSFFPDNAVHSEMERVNKEISSLKRQLLERMDQLHRLERQPAAAQFSEDGLTKFFARHPSMCITFDGDLRLSSTNQSVAFHTARGCNPAGRNDDIIYVTFPLYAFTLQFADNGDVVGRREQFVYREKFVEIPGVIAESNSSYGHPHVTMGGNRSAMFGSVCQGNNRFIHDYHGMCRNGRRYDGNELLRIFWQAAIWMESANLSDMYDTPLSMEFTLPTELRDAAFIDDLFDAVQEPLATGALGRCIESKAETRLGAALQHVYTHFSEQRRGVWLIHPMLFRCIWALWLWLHWNEDIAGCSAGLNRRSLLNAICADICVLLDSECIDMFIHNNEALRTNCIAMRSPRELATFAPRGNSIAERIPCLRARDMEETISSEEMGNEDVHRVPVPGSAE